MEMEGKWLKKCSTTDAVKKIQKKKENKKLKKSFKPVKKMKKKLSMSSKETVKQVEPVKKPMSICVNGLDASLSEDDIKTALRNHFGSCGVVEYIFVPTVFETGATKGCAHIDMRAGDEDKALTLDGSFLGGRRLQVRIATFGPPMNSSCKTCPLVIMEGKMERFLDCLLTWKFERAIKYGCTLEQAKLKKWENQ